MSTIEKLQAKKQELEKRIARARAAANGEKRKTETHLKATIGGSVLSLLADPAFSEEDKTVLRLVMTVSETHLKTDAAKKMLADALL